MDAKMLPVPGLRKGVVKRVACFLALTAALSGCGAGGGSGSAGPPPTDGNNPCSRNTVQTHASLGLGCLTRDQWDRNIQEWAADYRAVPGFGKQWGLGAVHADRAYAHLKAVQGEGVQPGQGVTIGFVDSGIDRRYPSFRATRISEEFFDITNETGAGFSHGTAVASVAAGDRITSGSDRDKAHQGVVWGVTSPWLPSLSCPTPHLSMGLI